MRCILPIVASLLFSFAYAQTPQQAPPSAANAAASQPVLPESNLDGTGFYYLLLGYLYDISGQSQLSSQAFIQALRHTGDETLLRMLTKNANTSLNGLKTDISTLSEFDRDTLTAVATATTLIESRSTKLNTTIKRILRELIQTPRLKSAAIELELFYIQKLLELKQAELTKIELAQFLQETPEVHQLWYIQAALAKEEKQWIQALASLERALQLPQSPAETLQGQLLLIYTALDSKDPVLLKHVYTLLQSQIQDANTNPDLLLPLSALTQALNQNETTLVLLERFLAARPKEPMALNSLGYTLADANKSLDRAWDLINQALTLRPDDPEIIDSMGWVEYRRGNLEAARQYLERAYALLPLPEIAAHLGEVYWALKDQSKGQDIWFKALDVAPQDTVLLETIHRLAPQLDP